MEYREALDWLYGTQLTGIKLGLENIRRLLGALGLEDYDRQARFLHVAGTNGKGSVCAMMEVVSRAAGHRTGLFTSPHLVSFRERIRIDGEPVSESEITAGLTYLRETAANWNPALTFFELATALAVRCFARAGVEVIAWETGLGGRLDATNAITPAVSVLTAIDMDHQAYLGDTLEAIAREKAGIIKPGVPVLSGPQLPAVAGVIEEAALRLGAALTLVTEPDATTSTGLALKGSHQQTNAALALAALRRAGVPFSEVQAQTGLRSVRWPGRFQRLENGRTILDGAHNPAAARRLAQTWSEECGANARASLVLGILRDKDAAEIIRALVPLAARIYLVPPASPRALAADELRAVVHAVVGSNVPVMTQDSLIAALDDARRHPEVTLVAGSLFLVGEAIALLDPEAGPMETSWQ